METPTQTPLLLPRLRTWLSPADTPRAADLIFVLAGKVHRKEYALELFRQGLAPRILFSVGRFEIRRFSKMQLPVPLDLLRLAQEISPPQRHYFASFHGEEVQVEHVPPGRFGTLTETGSLARWLDSRSEIRSLLVISGPTHLRRLRMCCRTLLSSKLELSFLASYPSTPPSADSATPRVQAVLSEADQPFAFASVADDLLELFKVLVYWVLLRIRPFQRGPREKDTRSGS